jgi:hypothetical protein
MDFIFDFDALDEVLSLADPYQAEPTSLANPCRPEVTRPVEEMKLCFCGGEYEGDQCQREDCPHCKAGYKSGQVALLQELRNQGQLDNRYPHLTPQPLRVWRKPSSGGNPALGKAASSSSGGNPDTLEPAAVESDKADKDEVGYDSEVTIHDSDESGASIFGLRRALHEVEEGDELSDSSSQGNDEMAVAERERVYRWRTDNLLLDDQDFAYVFADFEEAYSHAGRAVAVSWSRARVLAEPDIVTDEAKISAVEATATKIRRVDERKKAAAVRKKELAGAAFLRQPGKSTEVEEKEGDRTRFIEPLVQLMKDCGVGLSGNASATDEETMNSLRHRARQVVGAAEIPTLHRAITTAAEVRKHLEDRAMHMGADKLEPTVLKEFLGQSRARVRAVDALCWMCKSLQLGGPMGEVWRPDIKEAHLISTKPKQAPVAQPEMLEALADAMETGAEKGDPANSFSL